MPEPSGDYVQPRMPAVRGLLVSLITLPDGRCFYAEVEPAPLRYWRPWDGRSSRWWFEVHSTGPNDDYPTTYAYEPGGSGGGLTLRACVRRAANAVGQFAIKALHAEQSGFEGADRD